MLAVGKPGHRHVDRASSTSGNAIMSRSGLLLNAAVLLSLLGGCAAVPPSYSSAYVVPPQPVYQQPVYQQPVTAAYPGYDGGDRAVPQPSYTPPPVAQSALPAAALGAVAGGLIGSRFGSGNGRTAVAATGAALGAVMGANAANPNSTPITPGTVIGGVVGGLVGSRLGQGNGKTAAAALGAAVGAMVGSQYPAVGLP
jgi:uncharacterized protein YcfJ